MSPVFSSILYCNNSELVLSMCTEYKRFKLLPRHFILLLLGNKTGLQPHEWELRKQLMRHHQSSAQSQKPAMTCMCYKIIQSFVVVNLLVGVNLGRCACPNQIDSFNSMIQKQFEKKYDSIIGIYYTFVYQIVVDFNQ